MNADEPGVFGPEPGLDAKPNPEADLDEDSCTGGNLGDLCLCGVCICPCRKKPPAIHAAEKRERPDIVLTNAGKLFAWFWPAIPPHPLVDCDWARTAANALSTVSAVQPARLGTSSLCQPGSALDSVESSPAANEGPGCRSSVTVCRRYTQASQQSSRCLGFLASVESICLCAGILDTRDGSSTPLNGFRTLQAPQDASNRKTTRNEAI